MNNEVLVDIYSDDLTDAEAESLFSTTKESKRGDRRKRRNEKHGLTLRGHVMACRCMTICISTAKTKSTARVNSAVAKIISDVISLPSRK